jgi:hypothetical protein
VRAYSDEGKNEVSLRIYRMLAIVVRMGSQLRQCRSLTRPAVSCFALAKASSFGLGEMRERTKPEAEP